MKIGSARRNMIMAADCMPRMNTDKHGEPRRHARRWDERRAEQATEYAEHGFTDKRRRPLKMMAASGGIRAPLSARTVPAARRRSRRSRDAAGSQGCAPGTG